MVVASASVAPISISRRLSAVRLASARARFERLGTVAASAACCLMGSLTEGFANGLPLAFN